MWSSVNMKKYTKGSWAVDMKVFGALTFNVGFNAEGIVIVREM